MKILFVVNPIAGGTDKKPLVKKAKRYCKYYGIQYKIYKTTGKDDQRGILKKAKKHQPNKVIAIGGDGTLLMTGIALKEIGVPIGFVPMGSANGMAKELGVPEQPMKALTDALISYKIAALDLIVVNGKHYCMHIGDIGLNAATVSDYEQDENRGMLTYAKYFLKALKNQEPFQFTVKTMEDSYEQQAIMLAICNGKKFGTGISLNNTSNPFDGKFELVLVKDISPTTVVKSGISVFNDTFFEQQIHHVITTEKATVTFDEPRLLQLDGEVAGTYQTLEIGIEQGAIPLITSGSNPYL